MWALKQKQKQKTFMPIKDPAEILLTYNSLKKMRLPKILISESIPKSFIWFVELLKQNFIIYYITKML